MGLLPSMDPRHPATAQVRDLWVKFKSRNLLTDVRHQAALSLHAGGAHYEGKPGNLEDGRVVVTVPDPVLGRLGSRNELTFDQGRDVMGFGTTLLDAVGAFVDELLDVFERWSTKRWTPPASPQERGAAFPTERD